MSTKHRDMYGNPKLTLKKGKRTNVMRVNKLVAMAFLGATIKNYVHHKDGDLTNCRADNLLVFERKSEAPFELTHDIALREFAYNKDTGEIFRIPPQNTRAAIRPSDPYKTGCIKVFNGKKYIQISIKKKQILAHRLALFIVNKEWPEEVDHIDGDGTNNRFSNLRVCSHAVNCRNVRYQRDEDHIGIGINKGRWWARAGSKAKFGLSSKEEAIQVRDRLRMEGGFHENHGKRK